ncbi:peptidylprolyl isomerase [Lysinibacillus sp. NPDC096418]|uniref:peptidylprolyl isomerase n=1 Tax=Lysinibacillus sp. NPDC096418 TaxID=3364138 RepID=UPI0038257BEF
MLKYKRSFRVIVLPIVLSALLVGCSNSSDYVAKVEGEKILQTELDEALLNQYGAEVLDTLITNKIVELEAKKQNINVSDEVIQAEYEEFVEAYGGVDSVNEVLEANGLTEDALKDNIRNYQLTKQVIAASIEITDEEVEEYFENNKDNYGQDEQIVASHILLEDETTAKEVLTKVKAGEDFAELAKEYSVDTETKEDGGDLGYVSRGRMDEAFEEAMFALEKDAVSEVVQTPEGYHIIKVTGKVPAEEAVFEDIKDEVYETVLESRVNDEYAAWVTDKKAEYDIETKLTK